MNIQDWLALAAVALTLLTAVQVPLLVLMFRIGRGQATTEAKLNDMHSHLERIEEQVTRINGQVQDSRERIARIEGR